MTIREIIVQDYNAISQSDKKSTLASVELKGAIAYAKEMLQKDPNDATIKPWLTIIAQRESDNTNIRYQLDELKDFVDASGKRIIPAPVFDRSIPSTKSIEPSNTPASPENIKDIKSLLLSRKKGHIESAIKNGFYPIPKDKKSGVENYIEDKFAIMNSAIDAKDSFNERRAKQRAQEAYKDIIYCVTSGGNMNRSSGQGEEIVFRMNGSDVQDAKDYLLNLINKEIPASNVKSDVQDAKDATKPDAQKTESKKEDKAESNNSLKYNLEKYASYATRELGKIGKTIENLQTLLVMKLDIPLVINGVFDQSTLDAVRAFQRSVPNIKYGDDGLVGPVTIGELFGKTTSPDVTPVQPQVSPESEVVEMAPLMKKFEGAMIEFRSAIKSVSDKSGVLFDTPEEIAKNKKIVSTAIAKILPILRTVESQKLSKEEKSFYDSAILEIARYFDNTLDGVKNRHYRNYDLAFDLALSLIQADLKKQNINVPPRPSEKDVLASLKDINPKLLKKVQKDLRSGYQLGQILSNPQVRSEWDDVYKKIYGKYEENMQNLLTKLKNDRPTLDSAEGQSALDTMISIMGTKDYWDLKARNRDLAGQTAGMVGSTVAGVGAVLLTPFTGGTSTILGGALLGGAVTTAGMIATKGRGGLDRETGTELGINIVTFGAGGALAKGANLVMKSGTVIARTAGITLDAAGGIGLGMTADHVRAWEANTQITLSDSFKNNWYWALLPIAMGMKSTLRNKAIEINNTMNRAADLAHAGDTAGAQATIHQAETQAPELAQAVRTQVQREHAVTPTNPAATSSHGPSTAPTREAGVAAGQPENTTRRSARVEPDTYASTDINNFKGLKEYFAASYDGPNGFNPTIFTSKGGKYDYTFGRDQNGVVSLRKLKTETTWEVISDTKIPPSIREQMEIKAGRPASNSNGVPPVSPREANQAAPQTHTQETTPHTSAPEAPRAAAANTAAHAADVRANAAIHAAESTPAHAAVGGEAVQKSFIGKHGDAAWKKLQAGYNNAINGTKNAAGTLVGAPGKTLAYITNWGHGASWGKSFVAGAVIEGVSIATHPFDKEQWRDVNGNINWGNAGEALAYAVIAANCGIPRALLASAAWGMYDLYKPYVIDKAPGAQVPPPTK